jgi:hypothetical protein
MIHNLTYLTPDPMTYLTPLFAQMDAASTPIPLALAVIMAGWYCVKHKGAQWYVVAIGIVIGHLGSGMFIGESVDTILGFLTTTVTQVWSGLGSAAGKASGKA